MKKYFKSEKLGSVYYEESFWTGKRKVSVGEKLFSKDSKKSFIGEIDGEYAIASIEGNIFSGTKLLIKGESFTIYPSSKWYEILFVILSLVLVIVWGNSIYLCSIIPVVGGAIGGLISGVVAATLLLLFKSIKKPLYKVLVGIGGVLTSFILCMLVGLLIIALF